MKERGNEMNGKAIVGVAFALFATVIAWADPHEMKPYVGSAEFEKMKSLAGKWTGASLMEGKDVAVNVEYRITSGGSAVIETIFAGTPKEMVTVYHDGDDGTLSLTHYCMLQNRPVLSLLEAEGDTLQFSLSESCGLHGSKDPHMHSLALSFEGGDKIVQRWAMWSDGAEAMSTEIVLTRVKS